jgi:LuxR family transcriptional regulator, maltose regulon positive regulatory protein
MDPAFPSGTVGGSAPDVRGGIVFRRELFERLGQASRLTQVSAPPGSGKTFLLRSWIGEAGLAEQASWVPVQRQERDPQRFWIAVADALRETTAGSALVRKLTATPDLDGWAIVERLLKDLSTLDGRLWLVIDDVHELGSTEALHQLELLVMRAPPELRFVLATRHDLRLGLHRLRLEGELTEIRATDLRFTLDEARGLFEAAGVQLPGPALALLLERTEGWAAGLRLAALLLPGHPDPERFAAEFSGSERTVAEYLLAEVLERQPEQVRRLLLRTSVLERVNGPLADLLTGGTGGEGILQDLEEAGAFVMSVDAARSWFRYHQLFADLLQVQLRRSAPSELLALHGAVAGWFADHGFAVEAIRHAQAAQDWGLATRLLSDHMQGLVLDGQAAAAHELLARFPAGVVAADAQLAALMAADELLSRSLEAAEEYLAVATRGVASVPADRRGRFQVELVTLRLLLAQRRGDLPAVIEEAQRLLAPAEVPDAAQPGRGEEVRGMALVTLGAAELWAFRADEAEQHLLQGAALARRIGQPRLELSALAHGAMAAVFSSLALVAERSMQAIELAGEHGWTEEPVAAVAYTALGATRVWQVRLEEAESLLNQAGRAFQAETQPAAGVMLYQARGSLELVRGRDAEALAVFRTAERLAGLLVTGSPQVTRTRALLVHTLVRMGAIGRAEAALAEMDEQQRELGEIRIAVAALRLAQDDAQAATVALVPVLEDSVPLVPPHVWMVQAFLLEAIARDALGDPAAAGRALERALDLAEPDGALFGFVLQPVTELLKRHVRHRTSHAALVSQILTLMADTGRVPAPGKPERLQEPLSDSEIRVLRYLPTNLPVPEIADQLSVSVNTIRTHMRHLYAKLGVHHRSEAVKRASALGLLAPSWRRP